MTRSKWKGDYINYDIYSATKIISEKLLAAKYAKKKTDYFIWDRAATITPYFVNKRVCVHAGNKYASFLVKNDMVNHKFGEYALTKRFGIKIHIAKRKKGKKK